jgi:hypothetical protein
VTSSRGANSTSKDLGLKPNLGSQWSWLGLYLLPVMFVLFLVSWNLGDRLLWGDEAETAVLARNVAAFGIPKTDDGLNHITLYGGSVDGNSEKIWILSPWLQQYLAAASFKLFGATTWASRAPFALIGWLCPILLAFIVYRIYRDHWIALSSLMLLGTSEIFLLHARQSRYYSLSVFGEILLLYGAYLLIGQNKNGAVLIAAALSLQFYSNYIVAAANLPALVPLAWILSKENKRALLWLAAAVGVFLLAASPWIGYAKPWQQLGIISDSYDGWSKTAYYVEAFQAYFVPWAFGLLPVFGAIAGYVRGRSVRKRMKRTRTVEEQSFLPKARSRFEMFLLCLLPLYMAVLLIPPGAYSRYLLPVLPVGALLAAVWSFRYIKWRTVAVAVLLLQCTTNGLALVSGLSSSEEHALRAPLFEYIGGITHSYQDRFSDVVDFLNKNARPRETVFVFDPEFPLIFYTPLKIVDARLAPTVTEPLPDWILSESASGVVEQPRLELPPQLNTRYEPVVLSVHNSPRGGSIPQPEVFQYRSAPDRVQYIIYKKRSLP